MGVVNATKHAIAFVTNAGTCIVPALPTPAFVTIDRTPSRIVREVQLPNGEFVRVNDVGVRPDSLTGLPPARPGQFVVASFHAAWAAAGLGRTDVLCVDETQRQNRETMVQSLCAPGGSRRDLLARVAEIAIDMAKDPDGQGGDAAIVRLVRDALSADDDGTLLAMLAEIDGA